MQVENLPAVFLLVLWRIQLYSQRYYDVYTIQLYSVRYYNVYSCIPLGIMTYIAIFPKHYDVCFCILLGIMTYTVAFQHLPSYSSTPLTNACIFVPSASITCKAITFSGSSYVAVYVLLDAVSGEVLHQCVMQTSFNNIIITVKYIF